MTGVSLRCGGREHLALPGGLAALRAGATLGIPLLAPWANRLGEPPLPRPPASTSISTGCRSAPTPTGSRSTVCWWADPGWKVGRRHDPCRPGDLPRRHATSTRRRSRSRTASRWPSTARDRRLVVDTTIVPTGQRAVPDRLRMAPVPAVAGYASSALAPADSSTTTSRSTSGIPTGGEEAQSAEDDPIGRRTFDDLYRLRPGARARTGHRRRGDLDPRRPGLSVRPGVGAGRPTVRRAEPMTAPTNSLVDGTAPLGVEPGNSYSATFTLTIEDAR